MLASVAVGGIQTLTKVDMKDNRNAVIVSTSIALALLVSFKPEISADMPFWLQILFGSGVTIGSLTAIVLNLLFFHLGHQHGDDVAVVVGRSVGLEQLNQISLEEFVSALAPLFTGAV